MKRGGDNTNFTGCAGKNPIGSAGEAKRIARRMNNSKGARVQAYACRHCLKWHVGGIDSRSQVKTNADFKRIKRQLAEDMA